MSTFLTYLFGLIVVGGVLFLLTSFAFGRGEEMAPAPAAGRLAELPGDAPATPEDVENLRLSVVLRGYRMSEVDWVLAVLGDQIAARDLEIARLRERLGDPAEAGVVADSTLRAEPATEDGTTSLVDPAEWDGTAAIPRRESDRAAAVGPNGQVGLAGTGADALAGSAARAGGPPGDEARADADVVPGGSARRADPPVNDPVDEAVGESSDG